MGSILRPFAALTALLIVLSSAAPAAAQSTATAYVISNTGGSGVHFRATPGGASLGTWPEGTRMTAAGETREAAGRSWRNVQAPDGATGWVAADFLATSGSATAAPTTATVANRASSGLPVGNTEGQNAVLRDAPGGTQIGSYPEGTTMSPISNDLRSAGGREWRNVKGPDGKSGWMAAFLLVGGTAGTTASSSPVSAGNPYSGITTDMRTRALAARARSVPAAQRRSTTPTPTATSGTSTAKPEDPKKKKS